ncbi:hypothetical protein GCM10025791_06960 [Halioxenophilus aromaticivorans]|uniref:Uncharacterized protein n=1 Tax=Halioxenophilus aromaticivorans TaxID=1306992 RepID=A0AAV3TYN8_9ALTE
MKFFCEHPKLRLNLRSVQRLSICCAIDEFYPGVNVDDNRRGAKNLISFLSLDEISDIDTNTLGMESLW